jgi:GTP-binding protein
MTTDTQVADSSNKYKNTTFLTSAAAFDQLPLDEGIEVAFIGCSNAGKSSALNTITGIKGLARISKTPGRTQLINLFRLDDQHRLVDLPGYGYAKVPLSTKKRWQVTVNDYLHRRQCLQGLVIVMDIRHPLKSMDIDLLEWAIDSDLPVHILLTKVDKLKRGAAQNAFLAVKEALTKYGSAVTLQTFSSLDRSGLDEARTQLDQWFSNSHISKEV